MADPFEPLDLSAAFNAGTGNVETDAGWLWPAPEDDRDNTPLKQMPDGDCLFWGVPFSLGASEDKRFVLVADTESKSVQSSAEVTVGKKAARLLFAHVCAPIAGEWSTRGRPRSL